VQDELGENLPKQVDLMERNAP